MRSSFMTWFWSAVGPMLLLVSCTAWERRPLPHPQEAELPRLLRVSAGAEERPVVLTEPFVREDTLLGRVRGDTVGIALGHIHQVERPRLAVWKTVGTVLVAAAAWIGPVLVSHID